MRSQRLHDAVPLVLAVGLATAINLITIAVLYDAIFSEGPGLSDNATQILTTALGGIIGVLGSYLGYRAQVSDVSTSSSATSSASEESVPDSGSTGSGRGV